MEEVEKENVDAGEDAHQAGLHDEEEPEIESGTFGFGLERVETSGETDDTSQHEKRERDTVEAKVQADTESGFKTGVVLGDEVVIGSIGGGKMAPKIKRDEGRDGEAKAGDDLTGGKWSRDQQEERGDERRRDGEEKKVGHGGLWLRI